MASTTVTTFRSKTLSASLIRPSNTTAYAAGDVISAVTTDAHYEFTSSGDGGLPLRGSIDYARMMIQCNAGTKPDLELWLFHTDIAEVADNSAFAPTDTEILTLLGVIDFPVADWKVGLAGADAAGNIVQTVNNLGIIIPSTAGSIYGQLVVRNAYTPISAEVFRADLVMTLD